jgi:hypothetical protein
VFVLLLIHVKTRQAHVAGITPNSEEKWMVCTFRDLLRNRVSESS